MEVKKRDTRQLVIIYVLALLLGVLLIAEVNWIINNELKGVQKVEILN